MIALDGSHRLGGAALVAGSLLFLAAKLDAMSLRFLGRPMPDLIAGGDIPLILLGQLCLLIGFSGLYRFHVTRLARSGRIALGLLCGGGMALALGHVSFMDVPGGPRWATVKAGLETGFLLVLLGLLLTLVGLIWLGILNLRRPFLGPWRWLPLVTGIVGVVGFVVIGIEEVTVAFLAFRTAFALGLVALGIDLWRGATDGETKERRRGVPEAQPWRPARQAADDRDLG
ncbi:MAG: hypothetical protein KDH92_08705 [Chloroflexi bacterium]|nr:hypothetical protein [Chloroflexota bacterium]